MKQMVKRIRTSEPQKRRKSVAPILRASYALFSKEEETLMAVKMVLGWNNGNKEQSELLSRTNPTHPFNL
jgi:hypothetical protein